MLALADIEIVIDGVALAIHGIQVRADANGTEVALPRYRAPNGEWKTAVTLPEELKGPMGDAVLAAGIEAGVLAERKPEMVAV